MYNTRYIKGDKVTYYYYKNRDYKAVITFNNETEKEDFFKGNITKQAEIYKIKKSENGQRLYNLIGLYQWDNNEIPKINWWEIYKGIIKNADH